MFADILTKSKTQLLDVTGVTFFPIFLYTWTTELGFLPFQSLKAN